MFLPHWKGCKNTRFLYSEFTGGVVDDYALSCIYGHFRDRQGQHRWNLNHSDAVTGAAIALVVGAVEILDLRIALIEVKVNILVQIRKEAYSERSVDAMPSF